MRIRVSRAARRDLISIWHFIAADNPARADSFLDELHVLFRMLAENPSAGRRREELRAGIRSFPKDNYIVFYSVSGAEQSVDVVRVLSGYRDLDKLFEE